MPVGFDTYNQASTGPVAQTLCSRGDTQGGNSHVVPAVLAYGGNNTSGPRDVASALSAHGGSGRMDFESETFVAVPTPFDTTQITSAANRCRPEAGDPCHPLTAGGHAPSVAFTNRGISTGGVTETLRAMSHGALPMTAGASAVRRLTPRECERLMGFPDDYTLVPWRAGMATDGPRYKALGNSWAVNCARWIGWRIAVVDALKVPARAEEIAA